MKHESSSNPALSVSEARTIFGSRSEAVVLEKQIVDIETAIREARQKKEGAEDQEISSQLQEEIQALSEQMATLRRRQKQVLREQGSMIRRTEIRPESRL
mgnify:CR=1 FL=1